jgi:predicted nucleic acid-binding protein
MAKKKIRSATSFVLDASLTLAWHFEDETDTYAEAVEDALAKAKALVPSLWALEVANGLLMGERRKRTTEAKVTAFLSLLKLLPIEIDTQTSARAWQDSLMLARTKTLTVYDAAYLELAVRTGLPLASEDEPLKETAKNMGVVLYKP